MVNPLKEIRIVFHNILGFKFILTENISKTHNLTQHDGSTLQTYEMHSVVSDEDPLAMDSDQGVQDSDCCIA